MTAEPARPPSAYTVVGCVAAACGRADPRTVGPALDAALHEVVRSSQGGVLVAAGCLARCGPRPAAPVVVVQPCDAERNPTAPALRIGPLRTAADVDAVAAWLRAADLDPRLLPHHLVAPPRRHTRAG